MKKITVCIADMDGGYRASLRKALESSGSVEVVADAGDGLAALEAVETLHPQVLLTDTLLPGWTVWDCCAVSAGRGRGPSLLPRR